MTARLRSVLPALLAAAVTTHAAAAADSPIRYAVPTSAIASALAAQGLATSADQLRLASPLTATTPSPQLHITSAEPRPDGSLRLRIVCHSTLECLPFFASVQPSPDGTPFLSTPAGQQFTAARAPASVSAAAQSRTAPGVAIGAHITLELTDQQMRIHLPAVAIDTGAPGAEVRVSSLDHKQTWRGIVVDSTTVKGGLQ